MVKKADVFDFRKEAAKRGKAPESNTVPEVSQVMKGGNNNTQIVGDNNQVHNIIAEKVIHKPKVTVQPGWEVITEEQKVVLRNLVNDIEQIEKVVKKKPATRGRIWGATNTQAGVTSYHCIPIERFDTTVKFLRTWIGRLNSGKSAPKKDNDSWRNRHYSFIKVNVKKLNLEDKLIFYLAEKYGVTSLTELRDSDLKSVYLAVAGWKQRAK
ncbi:MAG: hypothetical protein FPO08_04480 [Geobacter sp.]|nr:MAG: hypothetical protein FPO08_04480 [Geobacter sp.]